MTCNKSKNHNEFLISVYCVGRILNINEGKKLNHGMYKETELSLTLSKQQYMNE